MVPSCNLSAGLQLWLRSQRLTQKMNRSEAIENLATLVVFSWANHLYDPRGIKWTYRYIFCGFQKENGAAEKG